MIYVLGGSTTTNEETSRPSTPHSVGGGQPNCTPTASQTTSASLGATTENRAPSPASSTGDETSYRGSHTIGSLLAPGFIHNDAFLPSGILQVQAAQKSLYSGNKSHQHEDDSVSY